jgi:hypothetical protein
MNTAHSTSRTGSGPLRGRGAHPQGQGPDASVTVRRAPLRRPQDGQVRVRLRGLGSMAVASVEAIGAHAVGFARGDRVVFPLTREERAPLKEPAGTEAEPMLVSADRLIGVPRDVGDEHAARLLAPGLAARVLLRQGRPVKAGDRVRVDLALGIGRSVLAAWITALGGTVSGGDGREDGRVPFDIVLDEDAWRQAHAIAFRRGHLQVGSADVFGAIRDGVFENVLPTAEAVPGSRAAA